MDRALTAYIFQDDHGQLTDEVLHGDTDRKGGRLIGLWTNTGNPVIRYVVSSRCRRSESARVAESLYENLCLLHIGEWRSVVTHTYDEKDDKETKARGALLLDYTGGREASERFVVLDVSRTQIIPFLFERQVQKGKGTVEILPGKNPFNRRDVFQPPQPLQPRRIPPRYPDTVPPAAAEQPRSQTRSAPQVQEAAATKTGSQWYSGGEGKKKLMKILEDFKIIAKNGHVDLYRDTRSQDISMSFTTVHGCWEVRFPTNFPFVGALLIQNPDKPQYRKEIRQAPSDKTSKAAMDMISRIIHTR